MWQVKADQSQLEQVIINLAVNARDAIGAGGTLTIWTSNLALSYIGTALHASLLPGNYVILEVSDT